LLRVRAAGGTIAIAAAPTAIATGGVPVSIQVSERFRIIMDEGVEVERLRVAEVRVGNRDEDR